MGKLGFKKTRIVKDDGRYLIYYTFGEQDEEETPPAEDQAPEQGAPPRDA